ncbi:MAG: response regulator transcription factor [Chloroflexi bacterium]|nr:response regulator transcription factor [Chloroflexota bacterium]
MMAQNTHSSLTPLTTTQPPSKAITVLIVDDSTLIREGVRIILSRDPEIEVVGEAKDGVEALEQTLQLKPDVVLMDIEMPKMNGIDATRHLKAQLPLTQVVMLTLHSSDDCVIGAIRAGAVGYVLKDASKDLICETVKHAKAGHVLIKGEMLRHALSGLVNLEAYTRTSSRVVQELSNREIEVLKLVAEGETNRQIGNKLFIAEVTVKKHLQSIISKLGALDRTHAAVKAVRAGLVN